MALGKSIERHAGQIRSQRADALMAHAVHDKSIVDFVSEQHEVMLTRNLRNLQQHFAAVYRAGRVIRVNHQNRLRAVGDLGTDILDIGVPFIQRVTAVKDGFAAAQICIVAPQRITRGRQQNLIARSNQRIHQHGRCFTYAVADKNVVRHDTLQAAPNMIGADDIARRRHASHVAVRHGLVDMQCQSLTNAVWQLKAKASGVAGVQFENIDALGFHPKCFLIQRSSDVGMHMIQSIRACNHFFFLL